MRLSHIACIAGLCTSAQVVTATAADPEWTQFGGDTARLARAVRGPDSFDHPRWLATPESDERFIAHATPTVALGRVVLAARVYAGASHVGNRLIGLDVRDGQRLWETDLPPDVNDSWSSPAIDVSNRRVLMGVRNTVYALELSDGSIAWTSVLDRNIANTSIAVTAGLANGGAPANRAYVVDYDGFGTAGKLYAIHVDPATTGNPQAPGEIAWRARVGRAPGVTPSVRDGKVYLAANGVEIRAYDALHPHEDPNDPGWALPDWTAHPTLPGLSSIGAFFGGVSVTDDSVLAATYDFFGTGNVGHFVSVDRTDGTVRWMARCERTDSTPLPLDGDAALISGGILGFGSQIKLQRFDYAGHAPTLAWDTADPTSIAPVMGGWTHQPARTDVRVYAGAPDPNLPPGAAFEPYNRLFIIGPESDPADAAFVSDAAIGPGGSPALAYGRLFSIGKAGLYAFDPSPACRADVSETGSVSLEDLLVVLAQFGASGAGLDFPWRYDVNLDGEIGLEDLLSVIGLFGATCE